MAQRPVGRPVMRQTWLNLVFAHTALPADAVRPLIPAELDLDLFPDETGTDKAWIGLVPFEMRHVRPVGLPPIPRLSYFPEANVRTYVHRRGREPGVWFFSLEAANALACTIARAWFGLPYYAADMNCRVDGKQYAYHSSRRSRPEANLTMTARIGEPTGTAPLESLDEFLIERYLLYALHPRRGWCKGRVHHGRYPLYKLHDVQIQEGLLKASSIPTDRWGHLCYSPGVTVDVFAPQPL